MSSRQLDIPEGIPAAEATLALAVGLFASGHFSQGRAAAFAGLSREAFIDALSSLGLSFTNISADDLAEEVRQLPIEAPSAPGEMDRVTTIPFSQRSA